MGTTDRLNGSGAPGMQSQTELRSRQRLEHIATKGLHDPDSLSRVEILEICKLVFCSLTTREEVAPARKSETRREVVAEVVCLSQEIGLE